jgi:hypothetical protein
MLLVARSVVARNWPSGLKASEAASELFVVRKREPELSQPESDDVAAAANVQNVNQTSMLSNGVRLSSGSGLLINKQQV